MVFLVSPRRGRLLGREFAGAGVVAVAVRRGRHVILICGTRRSRGIRRCGEGAEYTNRDLVFPSILPSYYIPLIAV